MKYYLTILSVFFVLLSNNLINAQNNALNFIKINSNYVLLPNSLYSSNFSGKDAITIEYWFKGSDIQSAVRFQDGGGYLVAGYRINSEFQFIINSDGGTSGGVSLGDALGNGITDGNWHHVACVWEKNTVDGFRTFIDGKLYAQKTSANESLPTINSGAWIGGLGASEFMNGGIDEVRIWNVARTESEIKQNMYSELTGSEAGLIAYYKFNETSGTNLTDSKNSYPGTLTSMTGNEWFTSSAFFGPKQCLNFDGSGEEVTATLTGATFTNTFTTEFWIKFNSLSNQQNLLSLIDGGASGARLVPYKTDNNYIAFYLYDGSNTTVSTSDFLVEANVWYHMAFSLNNGTAKILINGKEVATIPYTSFTIANNPKLNIASNGGGGLPSNANIDEVRIWNVVRNESDIQESMMEPLTGTETGLVAYYNFDNVKGNTLYDLTSNSFNGTLINMESPGDWANSTSFTTWLNTSSTDWSNASNWSSGIPIANSNVSIKNYTNEPNISGNPTFNNLYLGSGITSTLLSGMTINGSFILDNNLDLNGQIITLGSQAKLVEKAGLLFGSTGTITTTRTLDALTSLTNIGGLGAEIQTTSSLGSTTITRGHAEQTQNSNKSIKRYYLITPENNTNLDATLVFKYHTDELNGLTEDNLKLFKETSENVWVAQESSDLDAVNNKLTLTGISSFSKWTAAENSAFPVALQSFRVDLKDNIVSIFWQTATEINNYGFEIQKLVKSNNNEGEFATIGFMPGHGNSNSVKEYIFNDTELLINGKYFYRLKQIDNNGNYSYSEIIELDVNIIPKNFELLQNYPNPFNPTTKLVYALPLKSNVSLKVYDVIGTEIAELVQGEQEAGKYTVNFNGANISSGVYFYKLTAGNFVETKKMILIK